MSTDQDCRVCIFYRGIQREPTWTQSLQLIQRKYFGLTHLYTQGGKWYTNDVQMCANSAGRQVEKGNSVSEGLGGSFGRGTTQEHVTGKTGTDHA